MSSTASARAQYLREDSPCGARARLAAGKAHALVRPPGNRPPGIGATSAKLRRHASVANPHRGDNRVSSPRYGKRRHGVDCLFEPSKQ